MKPLVLVTAPIATRSGYGSHSRDIFHSLIDMYKFDIKIMSVRWGTCSMNALNESLILSGRIHSSIVRGRYCSTHKNFFSIRVQEQYNT